MTTHPAKKAHPVAPARRRRNKLSRKLLAWWQRLTARGLAYWLIVAALIGGGTFAGKICEEHDWALQQRYWIYQKFLYFTPWKARAGHTAVVLVKDKEYWQKLQGRDPISRRYLADLIREIDACGPQLIAIDFNLEIPPQGSEDADLVKAIRDISQHRLVVLPVTLQSRGELAYQRKPQIYSDQEFSGAVRTGHIHVYKDIRPIPVGLQLTDNRRQESFAEAIVNLADRRILEDFQNDEEQPFATFLPREDFIELDATSVSEERSKGPHGKLNGKTVIVSGDWDTHELDHRHIDDQETPVGVLPGSFVQANYVEALLGSRTYRELPLTAALALEILLSTALVVLFTLNEMSWPKFIALCLVAIGIGYFLLENVGRFYDFYFPLLLLAAHGAFEQIKEMWLVYRKRRTE